MSVNASSIKINRADLKFAVRQVILEGIDENKKMDKATRLKAIKFVRESATYEQLLNLALNPKTKDGVMLESEDLAEVCAKGIAAIVTEATVVPAAGKPVTEGAIDNLKGYAGKAGDAFGQAKDKAGDAAVKAGSALADAGGKAGAVAAKIANKAVDNPQAVATGAFVLAGASLLAIGSMYIYKRFFSASAKACKGKEGAERTKCVADFKVKAISSTISKLKSSASKCAKAKDPAKCRANIAKEVSRWEAKKSKVS